MDKITLVFLISPRLGRHGKVLLTVPSQAGATEEKFIKKGEASGSDSLLDLDPDNTVFYVGGVPERFKVMFDRLLIIPLIRCRCKLYPKPKRLFWE